MKNYRPQIIRILKRYQQEQPHRYFEYQQAIRYLMALDGKWLKKSDREKEILV